jgi:hypothetical protein
LGIFVALHCIAERWKRLRSTVLTLLRYFISYQTREKAHYPSHAFWYAVLPYILFVLCICSATEAGGRTPAHFRRTRICCSVQAPHLSFAKAARPILVGGNVIYRWHSGGRYASAAGELGSN